MATSEQEEGHQLSPASSAATNEPWSPAPIQMGWFVANCTLLTTLHPHKAHPVHDDHF
jgi:hypothetical protein